jgi:23S rRNA (adenine2503-C2)-methyltransferase
MSQTNIFGFSKKQLENVMAAQGEPPFRGRQLFKWLYQAGADSFQIMTDLPQPLRDRLETKFIIRFPTMEERTQSADGTEKFLFRLPDGHPIETVRIPVTEQDRTTLCISSQAGCALACRFCATGTMGLMRDLTVGEIVGQLLFLRRSYGSEAFTNVVMMGMGEPLHNFDNVVEALRIMTDPNGLALGARRITLSTSGITPKIKKLAATGLNVRLALSLHAATQEKRRQIMPVAETFGLDKLMAAVREYADTVRDRVTFEYVLMDGFNDTMEDIKALSRLVAGINCKINVMAYNPVPGLDCARPSDEKVNWFGRELSTRVPAVTVRKSRGQDIDAACGQLAARRKNMGVSYEI